MTSRIWTCITPSDDFEQCCGIVPMTGNILVAVHVTPHVVAILPIHRNAMAVGVSDTCVKTLFPCCMDRPGVAVCTRARVDDPPGWTVTGIPRRRRTRHGLSVVWITPTLRVNKKTPTQKSRHLKNARMFRSLLHFFLICSGDNSVKYSVLLRAVFT